MGNKRVFKIHIKISDHKNTKKITFVQDFETMNIKERHKSVSGE